MATEAPTPKGRVRYRWSCQILYERYTGFIDLQRQKDNVAKGKGWTRARYWVATAGHVNDFFLEREYEGLAELAGELQAREEDYDFMRLMRASYPLVVQGSIRVELFEELPMQ
ncbi:MAG TPA: hypothetical protein VHI54_04305 [Actinomycetota bacterium]|nr:hypothetical protein [Actinomycetota bacterium]